MEFALVLPVLLGLLIGLLECGLLFFGNTSANFAVAEAVRAEAERGNQLDADQFALQKIRRSALGTTSVVQVNEIDVFKVLPTGPGTYTIDGSCGGPCQNRYLLDGTVISIAYPPGSRDVTDLNSDYLAVQVDCQYNWFSGVFSPLPAVNISPLYYVRLEPQAYS